MPTQQHDRTMPGRSGSREGSFVSTTFAVLRRHWRALAGATGRTVGLAGLAGLLLTAAIFVLARPLFVHMRDEQIRYHQFEDPYLHDPSDLGRLALCTLPLFLLLLGCTGAALQSVCSRAVAAGAQVPAREAPLGAPVRGRRRAVLAVYALRGLIVWSLPVVVGVVAHQLTGYQIDTEDEVLARGSWPHTLVSVSPVPAVFVAVLLRLALTLAPAAAADGLGPLAALRRSVSLTWARAGAVRVLALAVPLAALTAGLLRLVVELALPLRPLVRGHLEPVVGNFFAAYYAGILAPVLVGVLVTAAVVLPVACTAFAVLHERLRGSSATNGD
jgi:hypothetical protein